MEKNHKYLDRSTTLQYPSEGMVIPGERLAYLWKDPAAVTSYLRSCDDVRKEVEAEVAALKKE
jgi:hypothetical protein